MRNIVMLFVLMALLPATILAQCTVSLGDDIVQCNGNPVTLVPVFSGTDGLDSLRIQYDATQGVSGLVGASTVYFHSGVQTVPFGLWEYTVGNWGANDGLGQMTPLGNNLWQITIHVQSYYGLPGGTNVNGLWMVFRNADGSATGKNDTNDDIFLYTSNGNTSDFGGISATDIPATSGSFSWSTNEQTQNITVTQSGTYTVTYTDGVGCTVSDQIEVEFGSGNVMVDLGPDQSLCDGETILLDAGSGFASYQWSTSETSQTLEVGLPGDYVVTVTDQSGCTGIDLINISTGVSPEADFSYTAVTGTTVSFTDIGTGATTVYWDFNGDGNVDETTAGGATVQYDFGSESVFGVVMVAENGCGADTTSQNVLVQDVSVEELKEEIGFSVFPNPYHDVLYMNVKDLSMQITAMEVMDLCGKRVQKLAALPSGQQRLTFDQMQPGMYVLQIVTSKGTITERIIKQ